jgi:hypothetical protein
MMAHYQDKGFSLLRSGDEARKLPNMSLEGSAA